MADEAERFIPSLEGRQSDHHEASQCPDDSIARNSLESNSRLIQAQTATDAFETIPNRAGMNENIFDISRSTSRSRHQADSECEGLDRQISETMTGHRASKSRPHIFMNWWKELLASMLVLGALLALFATLKSYDGKPSPGWPNYISLNTIISIYAVLMDIGIVLISAQGLGQLKWSWFAKETRPLHDLVKYDDATRGPWGAFRLLWTLRARDLLSTTGALIIVFALGLSPFAQQIVHYYDCAIQTNGTARSPRTSYYLESGGFHLSAGLVNIMPDAQRAVLAGIFSPSGSPDIHCSTGNCTWPTEYSTIGYCSTCKDISAQLVVTNRTYQYTPTSPVYLNGSQKETDFSERYPNGSRVDGNLTATSWMLQTAVLNVDGTYGLTLNQTIAGNYFERYLDYAVMGESVLGYVDFIIGTKVDNAMLGSIDPKTGRPFNNIRVPIDPGTGEPFPGCNDTAIQQTWPCQGYGASRCLLYPCVKTFTTSIVAGRLTETLKETTRNWSKGSTGMPDSPSQAIAMLDVNCLDLKELQSLKHLGYNVSSGERWLAYDPPFRLSTWQSNNTFPESMMLRGCLYAMDQNFIGSFESYLEILFNGTVNGGLPAAENYPAGQFSGPQVAQWFFNFGSADFDWVNQTFSNVSMSLTNYIRQNGMANFSSPAIGVTSETKTCVGVRWGFMGFPATLTFLVLVFFINLVVVTHPSAHSPNVWKSSPLALLHHGVVDWRDVMLDAARVEDKRCMEKAARSITVKLDRAYDGVTHLEVQNRKAEV